MITMKGNLITLEPLDIEEHAKGYFVVSQDENIHRYTGNTVPKCMDETIALLKKYRGDTSHYMAFYGYVLARFYELKNVRIVCAGVKAGTDREQIKAKLRILYV